MGCELTQNLPRPYEVAQDERQRCAHQRGGHEERPARDRGSKCVVSDGRLCIDPRVRALQQRVQGIDERGEAEREGPNS